jgi:hypothetical protein
MLDTEHGNRNTYTEEERKVKNIYETLERAYDESPSYDIKIILGDLMPK